MVTKSVRQHKVVKGGKLHKSESPLICVIIAEGSTNALPASTSIPAHFCIPVSLAAVEEDVTSGFYIEVLYDSDTVGADVVLLHCCPQSCLSNPVEVYEDITEVLPVLEIFLTEESQVDLLFICLL